MKQIDKGLIKMKDHIRLPVEHTVITITVMADR